MNTAPIDAVAFDVNETLFTLDRLRPAFTDAGLDPSPVRCGSPGCCATGSP